MGIFKFVRVAFLGAILCAAALPLSDLQAAPYEFANFNLLNANQPFLFNDLGGAGLIQAINVPVTFNFTAQTGLSTADHQAILNIVPTVAAAAPAFAVGPMVDQPLNLPVNFSIIEIGTGLNLLSGTFTGDLLAILNSSNASIMGQDTSIGQLFPPLVTFVSAFGTFTTPGNSYNLGLNTLSSPIGLGPDNIVDTFSSNINGQFTANFIPVPEPASIALLAVGLVSLVALKRRS